MVDAMEQVDVEDKAKKTKKRSIEEMTAVNENKKPRLFVAKSFRKQLNQENSHVAVKQFLEAVNDSRNHDYIREYLDSGGSCLELLQTLEMDSNIPPMIVFELLSHILLRINASCPQYQSAAYEACRFMLNTHATVISKMINLSSTTPERKACLKLLTAMVAFSSTLAKDILTHINFHSTNIELLTKHVAEKNSVRDHFIRFLTAYLVDEHYPVLSVLLEKKGFITSIVKGLQFDSTNTLCLVITAMKSHILENPLVSKTSKMRIFNTVVVRDIVNLYNWKGPGGFIAQKNNKTLIVDHVEKNKVNECIHDFLMVLCTSHKFGIIFRDPLIGLGKKNQNTLMYTVLESLDRPWDHSYASELVLKICGACPDLAKTVWNNLKQFMEPRMSEKWLSAMRFAKQLIKELRPSSTGSCLKELNVTQISQIVQSLVSPLPIIKTILPESNTFDSPAIKYHVVSLLLDMLTTVNSYLEFSKTSLSVEDHSKLKSQLNNSILRNFPNSVSILKDYEIDADSQIPFLEVVFDVFEEYKLLCPDLLSSEYLNLSEIFETVERIAEERTVDASTLKVKMINTFIDIDSSKFSPHSPLFSIVVPMLFRKYYNDSHNGTLTVLHKLFDNCGVFEECQDEINVWINAILNLKKFDETVVDDIKEILKMTSDNSQKFLEELNLLNSAEDHCNGLETSTNSDLTNAVDSVSVRHRNLSPMILGVLKFSSGKEVTKNFKVYANFAFINLLHLQTRIDALIHVINKFEFLPSSSKNYAVTWKDGQEMVALSKLKGKLEIFQKFSQEFLFGSLDDLLKSEEMNLIPDLLLNLLDASIFYVTNLLIRNILSNRVAENCKKIVKYLIDKQFMNDVFIERILNHPVLMNDITFLSVNIGTNLILDVIKELLSSGYNIENHLMIYRKKMMIAMRKILKKPHKYEELASNIKELLEVFSLSYVDCCSLLTNISISFEKYQKCSIVLDILVYCFKQLTTSCQKSSDIAPLDGDIVHNLTRYFVILAKCQEIEVSTLSKEFLSYLKLFPHISKNIDGELFRALVEINDIKKENIQLAVFLMEENSIHITYVEENIESVCERKGVILPLLAVLVRKDTTLDLLKKIYGNFEKFLNKAIQKPQKAGQHFHQNHEGIAVFIEKCMPTEVCYKFWEKIQKFEVTEVFHANLLSAICLKSLNDEIDSKRINNVIMTFIHLQINVFKRGLKSDDDIAKAASVTSIFINVMDKLRNYIAGKDLKTTSNNDTVKLYCKFCLKYGLPTQYVFLKSLRSLLIILYDSMGVDDGRLILEMLASHSGFLGCVLGKYSEAKLEILSLFLDLCRKWPDLMERSHLPVLFASYGATVNRCDKILLALFEMYESKRDQTRFYDFQPFLWGKSAASHYSVKLQIENALWRQPKMGDVLEILQEDYVRATIVNYHSSDTSLNGETEPTEMKDTKCYDLMFLLPLFSQLLAPEQQVQTYKFTRSGALSLTVMGLSSNDKKVRELACHVLYRFLNHLEARQGGKDNALWIRYVEAVITGLGALPNHRLNNFAAIFLSRTASVLTDPNHVMYQPLAQYLGAKHLLDFGTVPELYTFLHSADVAFKDRRSFALQLLRDGLRADRDWPAFSRSMAFKLVSELYASAASDSDTKLAVLEVIEAAAAAAAKRLCDCHSLLAQLHGFVDGAAGKRGHLSMTRIARILLHVARIVHAKSAARLLLDIRANVLEAGYLKGSEQDCIEILNTVYSKFPSLKQQNSL